MSKIGVFVIPSTSHVNWNTNNAQLSSPVMVQKRFPDLLSKHHPNLCVYMDMVKINNGKSTALFSEHYDNNLAILIDQSKEETGR